MFIRKQGATKIMYLPVTTSTVLTEGALVAFSSGLLIAATSSSNSQDIVGVVRKTIAATDADYATARLVPVEVPTEMYVTWQANVTSGLVAADIGLYCDLTDSLTVNRGASSLDIAVPVKVISSTLGLFLLNVGPLARVKS
jgi:hypothetical protein